METKDGVASFEVPRVSSSQSKEGANGFSLDCVQYVAMDIVAPALIFRQIHAHLPTTRSHAESKKTFLLSPTAISQNLATDPSPNFRFVELQFGRL